MRARSVVPFLGLVLSLGAAVSLGVTRFAYGLLLPPMREALGWSYTLAGAMNTANAAGYMVGATMMPWLMRKRDAVSCHASQVTDTSFFRRLDDELFVLAFGHEWFTRIGIPLGMQSRWLLDD